MLFPMKAHYAAVAMLHLAVRYHEPQPASIREVAQEHQIPLAFLTQIFQFLRSAGLVTSTRGPSGGFRLSLPPEEISLGTVIDAVYSLAPHEPDVSGSERNRSSPRFGMNSIWRCVLIWMESSSANWWPSINRYLKPCFTSRSPCSTSRCLLRRCGWAVLLAN